MTEIGVPARWVARDGGEASLLRRLADERTWPRLALVAVAFLAAVVYLWNLTVNGYANAYYTAAALAGSQSASAAFFGSFDASNFITVDKPPLALWPMALSIRLFGLSPFSVLLPQALEGLATVVVLFLAVRRSFGPVAATVAGGVMALTPAAVLIFRFNNPDAMLTLLLVVAAYALVRALEGGSYRWVAAAGVFVGLAFLTKYLQAYLVLPGFAFVWMFSAPGTLRRRVTGLMLAGLTVLVASGWWVAIVEAIPLGQRPFIGGSTTGSPLDLIFGYDGLGRIFGRGGGPDGVGPGGGPGGGGPGGMFGGVPGPLRLFNDQWYGEVAWLLPLALAGLVVGLWRARVGERTNPRLAGYLLWSGWLLVSGAVFSFMDGIAHSYYAVALAPAVGALVGGGLTDMWRLRARLWLGGVAAGAALAASAWWCAQLLGRTPDFAPLAGTLGIALAIVGLLGLVVATVPRLPAVVGRLAPVAAAVALVGALLAPAVFGLATVGNSYNWGDPHPGPAEAATVGSGFRGGSFGGFGGNPFGGFAGSPFGGFGRPPGTVIFPPPPQAPDPAAEAASTPLIAYLVANRGNARWIVAANSANQAAEIQIASGLPVMAMGGFMGSDPTPTLDQLKAYVASGELRFVMYGGGFGRGGPQGAQGGDRVAWLTTACHEVDRSVVGTGGLYDCAPR